MNLQTMTFALVLSLAPVVAYAEDAHSHVDCSRQDAQVSSMTAEEKAHMQAECAKQKQHMDCGKDGMDMSNMTTAQREKMQAQCKQMHDEKSGMHSSKDSDDGQPAKGAGKGADSDATPHGHGAAHSNTNAG
jgi:hypothetical protein